MPAEPTSFNPQIDATSEARDAYFGDLLTGVTQAGLNVGQAVAMNSVSGGGAIGLGYSNSASNGVEGVLNNSANFLSQQESLYNRMLTLQVGVQNQSTSFSTLSNASKASHEAQMNTVRNIKS
jgi:hypothetical protein